MRSAFRYAPIARGFDEHSKGQSQSSGTQSIFVYREGEPNPSGAIYADWKKLYAAAIATEGPARILFDNSLVNPMTMPAGSYDLTNMSLEASLNGHLGNNVHVHLEDGVVFMGFSLVNGPLTLHSHSTAPIFTVPPASLIILQYGAQISTELGAAPFLRVPTGILDAEMLILVSGQLGDGSGAHTLQVDAGAAMAILADVDAVINNDIMVGAGQVDILVTSQSAFQNTTFPILEPALTTLVVTVDSFAALTFFQALVAGNWVGPPPTNVEQAVNRMAALLKTLNGGAPIP